MYPNEADFQNTTSDQREHKVVAKENKQIPVVEVFGPTMQGEGLVVGMRTVFIRFGLCDYECTMCDSLHAVKPELVRENARWLTQAEIASEVIQLCKVNNCTWVTFSGGNPCIHDLTKLCELLDEAGLRFTVETQGTKCPEWLKEATYICVSPKGPGMGEIFDQKRMDAFMEAVGWKQGLFIKVVVFDERDLEFASMIAERYKQYLVEGTFWLSLGNPYPPGKDWKDEDDNGRHWINHDQLNAELVKRYEQLFEDIRHHPILKFARFLPQVHVLCWGNKQGV